MSQTLLKQSPIRTGEEDVRQYLHEIRQYPRLDAQQERQLAMGCATGDPEAIRTMVNSNLRLVVSVAREYVGRGVPLLDLIQEGSIGLLVAAKKFDYTRENRFSTYATKWIRQGVTRCILNHMGLIRVPVHTAERMQKLQYARNILLQENGIEPTTQELSQYTGISEDKVRELEALLPQVCSLDVPIGEEGTLQSLLEDTHAPQPQEELVRRELKQTLDRMMERLTVRQQQVLRLRFGLEDGLFHTQEQIGKNLGISKQRVRQIEQEAILKLQKLGADLGLEDFLE